LLLDLPNVFGKSLCGPDFSFRIENYGYTIKPATVEIKNDTLNQTMPNNGRARIVQSSRSETGLFTN
jgi:hypothetical protein